MTTKALSIASVILVLAMIAAGVWTIAAGISPARLPVHWVERVKGIEPSS